MPNDKKETPHAQKSFAHHRQGGGGATSEKKSGKFIFANGDEYEGEYEQRMVTEEIGGGTVTQSVSAVERSGKGVLRCANGNVYEGKWLRDKLNGTECTFSHPSGCTYHGEFRDGLFDGQGVYKWPGGAYYEGEFKAGRLEGKGTFYDESGQVWVGTFRADQGADSTALLRFRLNV